MTASPRDREESAGERRLRVAALGDLHFDGLHRGALADLFNAASHGADVLALCGDLTAHGHPDQMRALVHELSAVRIPIVAVLGNHDHEGERADELTEILRKSGVEVLDGDDVVIQGVGFAGAKGFAGGFGRGAMGAFGEPLLREVVRQTIDEALKLETALRRLTTETRVVLLHYAPITDTVLGEPEMLWPFLGSSRLLEPLETHGASVVFHGHAHFGSLEGRTPTGTPVYNVAQPLLRRHGLDFRIWTTRAPERRRRSA